METGGQGARQVQRVYLALTLLTTLAAALIWGVNTLFLLDAGLGVTAAFAANAFFTLGQVIFEVPTGVVADAMGRRLSFLLGTITLAAATLLYLLAWWLRAPFWAWAATSMLLGLGFTFFSGATEAWLVDALKFTGYAGKLEAVFARGQMVSGAAMLVGSVSGGLVAEATNLGVPYVLRSVALLATLAVAALYMKDLGFTPARDRRVAGHLRHILRTSIDQGLRNPPVRWVMLAGPFGAVAIFAFYAMQPYLLELHGRSSAYGIAGLAAAIVAGAQIAGGWIVPHLGRIFRRRTTILAAGVAGRAALLALIGLTTHLWVAIGLLVLWGLAFAATMPVRQAYLNGLIPSEQRATVLSFDNLLASLGGAVTQPALGKVADAWSYSLAYLVCAGVQLLALPFILGARRTKPSSDPIAAERA
jgi:MFS family permease